MHLLLLLLLAVVVDSTTNLTTETTTEPVQAIDKINISAFVSDFSDASVENTSEVWTESLEVGPKEAEVLFTDDEQVTGTVEGVAEDNVAMNNVKAGGPEEQQPFAGSRGLVSNYRVVVLVEHLAEGRQFTVEEAHNSEDEISHLTVTDPLRNATSTCTMHTNGFGFTTTGVRCRTNRNLPQECFCWDGICSHPYYPLARLPGPPARATLHPQAGGLLAWTYPDPLGPPGGDNPDRLAITATFRLVSGSWLLPLAMVVRGAAYSLGAQVR